MPGTTRRDLVKLGAAATLAAGATAAPAAAHPRRHGRRLPVAYPLGPFTRDKANPILRPGTQSWESKFVFPPRSSATG